MVSLTKAGIDPTEFFGKTSFSGGHEQSVRAVLKGTYDACFTWTSEGDTFGNLRMMMDKGLIYSGGGRQARNPILALARYVT